ncbi:Histidine kinase [Hymenobacter arizonensis]|uniref:Histidine kinase n=1 Tax=Hymenobacter arizonensis TaxID=1227077 RepID=A0A1I5X835_HYMAR|nr:Histidine kinase [Hymenobacter arizonensis]
MAVHVALWVLYALYWHSVYAGGFGKDPLIHWGFALKDTVAAIVGFYFFSGVVLPRLLLRRRWLLTVLGVVAIYYTWALISYSFFLLVDAYALVPKTQSYVYRILDKGLWTGVLSWYGVSIGLFDFSVIIMPPLLVRFIQFLLVSSNRSLRLQRESLNLEINFLKAQVNPHFLFNTLNNLYTLVIKQDERAPAIVRHLADLMHYTVYESNAPLMPLAKETAFLESYLELERLRYGPKVRIAYRPPAPGATGELAPLLFFPFVENAFKHGIDSSLDDSWVEIELAVAQGQLHFAVRNSYSPSAPRREVGGVGIANVRKRLALHYAPSDYHLAITQTAEAYEVTLTLRLANATSPLCPSPASTVLLHD